MDPAAAAGVGEAVHDDLGGAVLVEVGRLEGACILGMEEVRGRGVGRGVQKEADVLLGGRLRQVKVGVGVGRQKVVAPEIGPHLVKTGAENTLEMTIYTQPLKTNRRKGRKKENKGQKTLCITAERFQYGYITMYFCSVCFAIFLHRSGV